MSRRRPAPGRDPSAPLERLVSDRFDLDRAAQLEFRLMRKRAPATALWFQCPACGLPMRSEGPEHLADELADAACVWCRDPRDPRIKPRPSVPARPSYRNRGRP